MPCFMNEIHDRREAHGEFDNKLDVQIASTSECDRDHANLLRESQRRPGRFSENEHGWKGDCHASTHYSSRGDRVYGRFLCCHDGDSALSISAPSSHAKVSILLLCSQ
jgi:hypothetical protein